MNQKGHKTSIGGQAVIEGIMMRGPNEIATAVRKPNGEIEIDKKSVASFVKKYRLDKIPIIRGIFGFFESMVLGFSALTYSASFVDIEDDEGEPSKFEKFLQEKFGDKLKDYILYFSVAIALVFSIGIFVLLPQFLVSLLNPIIPSSMVKSLIAGTVKLALFLGYVLLISQMNDIKRVFMYHGAEHKTIHCYEAGEELTVENVRLHTRLHPRCGTSFIIIVLIVSVIVFSFLSWENPFLRMLYCTLLLPFVAGLSYEVIKLAGRYENFCTSLLSAPGKATQLITTKEPDDGQIEVAIAALCAVLPQKEGEDKW